ncbi:phage virion morphogenesis protein [Gemmobacter sp. 24YEA27]|uniref:phage virion morphogenesis protein n=1 Tax=Gemmobacter sp. 24YEA27 TaxID=3040672 RepID=UPI0024B344F8|nr:phage virion morphogenesis protein [Gemmobacter sp. 24YEA27]
MAGITFRAELDDAQARARLAELASRMENLAGFYKNVGEYMTDEAIPRNFASETGPDGTPWASLRPLTLERRKKAGITATTILRATSRMAAGINYQASDTQLLIGSPAPQAAVMHFGAPQGSFGAKMGRTKPSAKRAKSQDFFMHMPWGDIPARPFLGFSAADEAEVIRIAEVWLETL